MRRNWILGGCIIVLLILGLCIWGRIDTAINGDVLKAYQRVELDRRGRGLWLCAESARQADGTFPFPNKFCLSSTEYFRDLLNRGILQENETVRNVLVVSKRKIPVALPKGGKVDSISAEEVAWCVVVACDGKPFSSTNVPSGNLPYLVSRNLSENPWVPALGGTLTDDASAINRQFVAVTFDGHVVHIEGKSGACFSCPPEFANITNRLTLIRPRASAATPDHPSR